MEALELHFLVAEDHGFQRRSVVRMLGKLGVLHVAEAVDGAAALALLAQGTTRIDIAIIDLNMPGMDGMELIRHMAEANSGVSIILASALERSLIASVETMVRAYGIKLLGAIEKPATIDNLRALIQLYEPPTVTVPRAVVQAAPLTLWDIQEGLRQKQFEPYFQPKVDFADGQVKGVEALARWRHPQHGLIAPAAFIPEIEANGLIDDLTWIIIEKSISALRLWQDRGLKLSVSINLSLSSLAELAMCEQIINYIPAQGIDAQQIIFEVTESVAMSDIPHCLENLARLRMRGYGLSIDDYGTGYSSMQQLLRIPFTELKIDQSFVFGAPQNPSLISILGSSLELARKLGLSSVAEGVETREEWDLLRDFACTYAQGYFVAKPMPGENISGWIDEWALTYQGMK